MKKIFFILLVTIITTVGVCAQSHYWVPGTYYSQGYWIPVNPQPQSYWTPVYPCYQSYWNWVPANPYYQIRSTFQFSGVYCYSDYYNRLVWIFNNYYEIAARTVESYASYYGQTYILTFDRKPVNITTLPRRLLIVEYTGLERITYYLEKR